VSPQDISSLVESSNSKKSAPPENTPLKSRSLKKSDPRNQSFAVEQISEKLNTTATRKSKFSQKSAGVIISKE
jgi:hypothetical protein